MNWEQECQDLFEQYTEELEEFKECIENIETLVSAIEQCLWL